MAHANSPSLTAVPAMDYAEHERSYAAFTRLTALGTVFCLNIALVLLISGLYSGLAAAGFLVLALFACMVGLVANFSWVPPALSFALAGVFSILVFAH